MAPFGTLYTFHDKVHPRSRKIFAAAKLNGLELTVPEFQFGVTNRTPEYLAKFPLGKMPSFESSTGFKLSESNAIAFYISEAGPKKDQLLGSTPEERALVQHWIFFSELQLETALWKVVLWRSGLVPFDAKTEADGSTGLPKWLGYLESGLKGRKWLLGDTSGPSLADLTISAAISVGYLLYIDAEMRAIYPETLRWVEQVKAIQELTDLYTVEMVEKKQEPPTGTKSGAYDTG